MSVAAPGFFWGGACGCPERGGAGEAHGTGCGGGANVGSKTYIPKFMSAPNLKKICA